MSIEKLERVLWRLRSRHPGKKYVKRNDLEIAIMYECGTDQSTYKRNRRALIKLGWIISRGKEIELTGKDLTQ